MANSIYQRLNKYFDDRGDWGAFVLRLLIGWRLIDGTQDNVFSWSRMLEFRDFLEQYHVAYPLIAASVSVYAQFICGVLYMIGLWIRPAALVMIINFIVALVVVHFGTTFQQSFEALTLLFGSLFFLFYGAGKISVEELINSKNVK
ncbi:DoxX family protein [Chryseolinea sp. H1M3-3]|uniref:DoxX family protein n=1 Tax=Chryseolinea sp. H1M3-3 TaxID=3034144 RepID=UPI0023EB7B80|nr:DoxX family protein [Chryseolinea sp. H1M3-3]